MTSRPRIWFSNREPEEGEIVIVRAMVAHIMETGLRPDGSGGTVPRNIINHFECTFDGEPILSWRLDTAVSRNPFLEFRFRAERSGALEMVWTDDEDVSIEVIEEITVV